MGLGLGLGVRVRVRVRVTVDVRRCEVVAVREVDLLQAHLRCEGRCEVR